MSASASGTSDVKSLMRSNMVEWSHVSINLNFLGLNDSKEMQQEVSIT